jgi:hypothetical protein
MQDQSTQRKVDATGDTPVDEPVSGQTEVKRPGAWGPEEKGDEQLDQTAPEPEPLKPFIIPKMSLFQDLPYSVTQVPPPPPTPPPAYSTTVPTAALPVVEPSTLESEQDYTLKATTPPLPEVQSRFSPPPPPEPSSLEQDSDSSSQEPTSSALQIPPTSFESAAVPPPVPAPLRTKASYERQRTPPTRPQESSQSNSPNQNTSSTEKRTTPKLNRNSGTRAIAQAQMFEAWARGQNPKDVSSSKEALNQPRPVSVAESSASEYSNPPKTAVLDAADLYTGRDDLSILPRTLTPSPLFPSMEKIEERSRERKRSSNKAGDPAVFGGFITPPDTTKERNETARRSGRISAEYTIQRKDSNIASLDASRSKGRLGSDRRPPSTNRTGTTSPEQPRRRSASKTSSRGVLPPMNRSKTDSPELKRQPSAARLTTKAAQSSRYSPPVAPPLPRSTSASSLQPKADASPARSTPTARPLTRTNTSPAPAPASTGRKGMTATMTSGTRNRAMTIRVGGKEALSDGSPRSERSRTNSNLFREIDDLVSGSGRSRSGTLTSGGVGVDVGNVGRRDEERRPPPLKRSGTSRVRGADGVRRDVPTAKREDFGEK